MKNNNNKGQLRPTNKKQKIYRSDINRITNRNIEDTYKAVEQYKKAKTVTSIVADTKQHTDKLKVTFLGGLYDVGEKNMTVLEYGNDAIVLDCGMNLGIDLPGVNYEINDTAYLESIKHKIKGYVITHGHLDHIGGLKHTVPLYPAPIYGSRYTVGIIEKTFLDDPVDSETPFVPELIIANIDNHDRLKIGEFFVEFIRVTHAIPDPSAICIDTPVGRIIATGDFRLDPEPLDNMPSDVKRLKELGREGVLLLMSDSSYADVNGRTPTEHTLQKSFTDIITNATGRIFVAVFSSNINRTQMIINAAVNSGRKVALDGRSMISYAEVAVRQGILKVPKGTIIPMRQVSSTPPSQVLVMCTGGQGEPNAALQRMSEGNHTHVNLNKGDTVIISSSPIPGNEVSFDAISNRLSKSGVQLFRHSTYEIDGCGPLHVSGHAKRDELREMLTMIKPKFFIPVHGGALRRRYHAELGIETGVDRSRVLQPSNGDSMHFTDDSVSASTQVNHGSLLINQSGGVVDTMTIQDRLLLSSYGFVSVAVTIKMNNATLQVQSSINTQGAVSESDNQQVLTALKLEVQRAVQQRHDRVSIDRLSVEIKEFVAKFLYNCIEISPMIIVSITSTENEARPSEHGQPKTIDNQAKFQNMRRELLHSK